MKRDEFFKWCDEKGLVDDASVAGRFDVSIHTAASWRQQSANYELPSWVSLACRGALHDAPMTRDQFFDWCDQRGISGNSAISTVFSLSSQTIRNWRERPAAYEMSPWIRLACRGFDTLSGDGPPVLPKITIGWFTTWQRRNHLKTYHDTSRIFGLRRQAVHNWYKRGRFPKWLALACAGHDARVSSARADSLDQGFETNRQFNDKSVVETAD